MKRIILPEGYGSLVEILILKEGIALALCNPDEQYNGSMFWQYFNPETGECVSPTNETFSEEKSPT